MSAAASRTVLSIAGSDPSGGAGVQADLKTFTTFGVDGCAVIAALTAQNEYRLFASFEIPATFLQQQIDAVLESRDVHALKVGMLGNAANVRCVANALRRASIQHVVVDPLVRASSGAALIDDAGLDAVRSELLPLATVITPNASEAAALLGAPRPSSFRELRDAAQALRELGAHWVLVTGGDIDAEGATCVDVLAGPDETVELRIDRVRDGRMHGSGCRLSSAIASLLALGASMPEACAGAQRFVARTIADTNARSLVELV